MRKKAGLYTRREIDSQPVVWQSTLDALASHQEAIRDILEESTPEQIVVTGCGSTYHLSVSTAVLLRKLGLRAWALPAAELVHCAESIPPAPDLLLAISRSGATTETLQAVDSFRERYPEGDVLAITTVPDSSLAQRADLVLAAQDGQEQSVAQTRSFTSMFLLAQGLAATLAHEDSTTEALRTLPRALSSLLARVGDMPRRIGTDLSLQRFFFLGSGPLYGVASEAMLKTKEMTLSWSEAYHFLEVRHGPMSVVDDGTIVVGLLSDSGLAAERLVLQELQELGARILAMTEDADAFQWADADYVVELRSGLDTWKRAVLYLPLIQWIAYHRALAKGLDPDSPANLVPVVEL